MRAAAIIAAGLTCLGAAAAAQGLCGPADRLRGRLAAEHGEARVVAGLAGGQVVELWLAPAGGWTLLAVGPDGIACLVGAGQAGSLVPPRPAGRDG